MLIDGQAVLHELQQRGKTIRGILHVGAHLCEELYTYETVWKTSRNNVVWVDANDRLIQYNKHRGIPNCFTAALDETHRDVVFKVTNNVQSSSLLDLGTHAAHYPHIVVSETIPMRTQTLSSFFSNNNLDPKKYNIWNFDIQGSELHVLRGSPELLKYVDALYTEVNTEEVYKGCGQLSEMDTFLENHGFERVLTNIVSQNWGDALYVKKSLLTVGIWGGLGNQLFELAGGETIAKQTNRHFYLQTLTSPETPHSKIPYFENIFQNWRHKLLDAHPDIGIEETPTTFRSDWSFPPNKNVILHSYLQHYKYISPSFIERLCLPDDPFDKNGVFLHIRGGDYVNHWMHDVHLETKYYPWAVQQFPEDTHFYVFTNDMPYAKSLEFLKNIKHSFVEADELQSLNYMRQCAGGICANSSFSWWGAYLNPNRKLILPSKWFTTDTFRHDGYHFPGCTIGEN
jgi:FkbM family methyltransferase